MEKAIEQIQSILDDAAATGDAKQVDKLCRFLGNLKVACEWRAEAIRLRTGEQETIPADTNCAMQYESQSEDMLQLAKVAASHFYAE